MKYKYLTLEEVLAIHFDQIERYGGSHGVRSLDLLLSSIARPQASFGGFDLYKNIYEKGASTIHSIILNHPFIDGNKRTAITALARFLYINDYDLIATDKQIIRFALKVATNLVNQIEISSWVKKYSKKINP